MKLEKADWLCFAATVGVAFSIYYFTLTPEVGLQNSGYFSTAAMYLGVPMPAGFPIWTLWASAIVHLLPFSNIDRRAAIATAVAGALACGMIALTVSQLGAVMLKVRRKNQEMTQIQHKLIRVVCGYVAGMIFGLDGAFWQWAVIADPLPLNILLLCLVIWLLMRWFWKPRSGYLLCLAALVYGLLLSDSQIELALAPAIPFFVALRRRKVGRDMLLLASILFLCGLAWKWTGHFQTLTYGGAFFWYLLVGWPTCAAAIFLTILTRQALSEWRIVLLSCGAVLLGLTVCIYMPLVSMTNPPTNWGYPRIASGFYEVVTRGQYNRIEMTDTGAGFLKQLGQYFALTGNEFGWPHLLIAAIPILGLKWLGPIGRRSVIGLLVLFIPLSTLVIAVTNPSRALLMDSLFLPFLAMSHVVLAMLAGCGLVIAAAFASCRCPRRSLACQP